MLPKITQESSWAHNWRAFAVKNAAIESITVFKHPFERFLMPFWRGRPLEQYGIYHSKSTFPGFAKSQIFDTFWAPFGTQHARFWHPLAPRGAPKLLKDDQKDAPWKKTPKKGLRERKRASKKPVLAREREARFIWGLQLTNSHALQKNLRKESLDFLNSSPTPSSRAIVYCTILCSAVY